VNILLINHYAGSTLHGMEFRPFYMAREWIKAGHNVQIVAASYSHIRSMQPHVSADSQDEIIDGVHYRWYSTPAYQGNGLGRVKNMISFLWKLWRDSKHLAFVFKPDVVIASSTYPMDIWPAKRIAKLSKAKLVFEVHDLWPLSLIELGGMSKCHPFIVWIQLAEDFAYKHVDLVVSMLPKALPYMQSRGLNPRKFVYVPNGIDDKEWNSYIPLSSDFLDKINALIEQKIPIIGYSGTHGLANSLDTLLDVAKILKGKANIIMVGDGYEKARLLERIDREDISNVLTLPAVEKAMIPDFLSLIDIAYIGWRPNPLYRFGISPNKLMDYMMASKPIVHAAAAGNDPVTEAGCGFTVTPGDPTAISEAALKIFAMTKEERELMGLRGKEFVRKNHPYSILAKSFLEKISDEPKK
jgi:glycosyltransferase involved in cell wall biosynthesis